MRSTSAVPGLQFRPVTAGRHRDLQPTANFLQPWSRDTPLCSEPYDWLGPNPLKELRGIDPDLPTVRVPDADPQGARNRRRGRRTRFTDLDGQLLEDLSPSRRSGPVEALRILRRRWPRSD